jgi:hypothetical protein
VGCSIRSVKRPIFSFERKKEEEGGLCGSAREVFRTVKISAVQYADPTSLL